MKKQYSFILGLLALFLSQLPINQTIAQKKGKTIKSTTFNNLSSKKMTVVFIHAPWDGWSRRMESMTFSDPDIVKYVNKNFNFISLDKESRKQIKYKDKTYKYNPNVGEKGCHELATELVGGEITPPTTVILDEDGNVVQSISGYIDAKNMEAILQYFREGKNEEQTWEEFVKEHNLDDPKGSTTDGSFPSDKN